MLYIEIKEVSDKELLKQFIYLPDFIHKYIKTSHITSAFTIAFNYDKRDMPVYPCHGWWMGYWYTHAVKQMGGWINNTYSFSATKNGYRADTKVCEEHFGGFVNDVVPPQIHFDLYPINAEKLSR